MALGLGPLRGGFRSGSGRLIESPGASDGIASVRGTSSVHAEIALADRQEARTMLVITRREGEEVVIGDPSAPIGVVRIAAIKGDRVRVAFEFPRTIEVHRREVAEQIIATKDDGQSVVGKIRPAANDGG